MRKLLFDLFPIVLFFIAFKAADIYVATAVAIVASIAQIGWLKLRGRPVEVMQWISLVIIIVFGGLTLLLQDEAFIKWKPTILYWAFGLVLVGGRIAGRNFLRTVMGSQLALPGPVWDRLNWIWTGFFAAMGALNLVVAYRFDTAAWVNFKLFGTLILTLVFVVGQGIYLSRHLKESGDVGAG
jgi:intracellular septation protein